MGWNAYAKITIIFLVAFHNFGSILYTLYFNLIIMAKQPAIPVDNTAPEKLVLQVENLEGAINALEAFAGESVMVSQILSKVEEVRNLSRVK